MFARCLLDRVNGVLSEAVSFQRSAKQRTRNSTQEKKKQMAQERQTSKQVQKERDKRKKNVRSMQLTQRPKRKYRRAVVKSRSADLRMLGLCQNKTRLRDRFMISNRIREKLD